jgi:L,D-peptidoglycan transpeptidase YkuD (ErfK/YbiS/YcfS/YnhG family)
MSRSNPLRRLPRLALAALLLTLSACASAPRTALPWSDARQLILVTTADWNADSGQLRRFEKTTDAGQTAHWREVGVAAPVMVGRNGSAWGIGLHPAQSTGPQKREGDGRAPAGVFALGTAFGYADSTATAWPYRGMDATDYCIDVVGSPHYNAIVSAADVGEQAVAGSTEPMRRDLHANGDTRYRLGFVIEHNPGAQPGAGSCIFAHLWKAPGQPTAGCTAMADGVMQQLLEWLDPRSAPVFVLLPEAEYRRVALQWQLPAPPR